MGLFDLFGGKKKPESAMDVLFSVTVVIMKAHLEMGRRPRQPAYPGKVDRESGCGFLRSNQTGQRRPS
jgi:hypothetical protein